MPAIKKPKSSVKSRAMRLVRDLPSNSSWDELMYRIYVRQKVEAGLSDLKDGRTHRHDAIRREFGLDA